MFLVLTVITEIGAAVRPLVAALTVLLSVLPLARISFTVSVARFTFAVALAHDGFLTFVRVLGPDTKHSHRLLDCITDCSLNYLFNFL